MNVSPSYETEKESRFYEKAEASALAYAAWRDVAERRLDDLVSRYWEKRAALDKLNCEISDLRHVMGNGASGGTAWQLPCNQTKL